MVGGCVGWRAVSAAIVGTAMRDVLAGGCRHGRMVVRGMHEARIEGFCSGLHRAMRCGCKRSTETRQVECEQHDQQITDAAHGGLARFPETVAV